MFLLNLRHLFISVFGVAALTGCGASDDEPTPISPGVNPADDVVFFDDFDSFNSAYWSKETHESFPKISSLFMLYLVKSS